MERLSGAVVVSQASRQKSATPNLPAIKQDRLPAETERVDRLARLVSWRGTDGSTEIVRALTAIERTEMEKRRDALVPALEPFDRQRPGDLDRAATAVADMYGSFPSMRQEGEDAVARINSLIDSLARQGTPTWAIEQACRSIQDNGYIRTEGTKSWTEHKWPPSDSEVAKAAQRIVRTRAVALANAKAVLTAKVSR